MVAGGPYGIEDVVGKCGYAGAILILIALPLIWAVPTALMVSELSGAIPEDGGFYVWVRRACGPFWGYQEAWLTLAGSMFDMAIYPTLFAAYLARLWPALGEGSIPLLVGAAMIAGCVAWNLCSAGTVGRGSILVVALVLAPFVAVLALALAHGGGPAAGAAPAGGVDIMGGILVGMWNYMGWDNASTVAGEVNEPRKAYPRTMFRAVIFVTASYLITVGAMALIGVDLALWTTGGWVDIGRVLGGTALATALMLGAALANVGTFNALVLSLSRLPAAMAEDGFLPRILAWRHPRTAVPIVSLVVCALTWAVCQGLGFESVLFMDVLLSGLSMLLEFWALVVLRVREPRLARPYRIPGGVWGCVAVGVGPVALIGVAMARTAQDSLGDLNALAVGVVVTALGPALYALNRLTR